MDSFQWFILSLLGLLTLAGAHRRYVRYRLVVHLMEEGKSDKEIKNIMAAYKGE